MSKNLGTTVYNAPEAHKGGQSHGGKIDIWAAGMIALIIFFIITKITLVIIYFLASLIQKLKIFT